MSLTPEFWLQLIVAVAAAVGTYSAIRADLATLHERTKTTKEVADMAHHRIDEIQSTFGERRRNT